MKELVVNRGYRVVYFSNVLEFEKYYHMVIKEGFPLGFKVEFTKTP